MAKTIYVLTEGSYSDYHIVGVFSTRALAEVAQAAYCGRNDDPIIEEWTLDEHARELREGWHAYLVRMTREGVTSEIDDLSGRTWGMGKPDGAVRFDHAGNMYTKMFARDEKHAVKIANERRTRVLAADAWGTPGGWSPDA